MRSDTKLKIARRKHTLGLLKWLYSRRSAQLDGTKLSLEYRRSSVHDDTRSLTYGEVDVPDFLSILDLVKPQDGEVFVDLGSGTGKAVLTAACGFPEFVKCRGIELVQGLADAAADHLQTAKTFLAKPRAPAHTVVSANDVTGETLTGERATPVSARASLGKGKLGQAGGGGRKGKKPSGSKALNQGLSACDLEALIAELLSRQPSALHAGGERKTVRNVTATAAGDLREATAEEIASWLVREMGHRRQSSLRGYGGLQKFLVARRRASDASSRLSITQDGTRVTVCLTTKTPSALNPSSSQLRDAAAGERCDKETTHCSGLVEQDCRGACRDIHDDAEGASNPAATVVPLSHSSEIDNGTSSADGSPPPSTTREALPTACSLTSSMLGLSCDDSTPGDGTNCKDGSVEDVVNRRRLPEPGPLTVESLAGVELLCGDVFEEAWDDAGVVYVASLLFDESMMALLAQRVQRLRPGARIISLKPIPVPGSSRELSDPPDAGVREGDEGARQDSSRDSEAAGVDPGLRLLHEGVFRMSWQMARVYIYVRL
ncbi:unnamed protein product [Ectocarpus fasciculatus]